MCNYTSTSFLRCGHTESEQTERCGYLDDDFSQCMRFTEIREREEPQLQCPRCVRTSSLEEKPQDTEMKVNMVPRQQLGTAVIA